MHPTKVSFLDQSQNINSSGFPPKKTSLLLVDQIMSANQRTVFLAVNHLNSYTDSDLRKKQTLKTPPHNVFGEPKTVADTKLEFLIEYAG